MLLQFTVSNFRSFKEPTTISFVKPDRPAANEIYARPEDVLRTVAIYGANASGKSNVVKALKAFRSLVLNGVRADAPMPREAFAFDEACDTGVCGFEIEVRTGEHQLGYSITFDATQILAESIVEVAPDGSETSWLQRESSAIETGGTLEQREGAQRLDFIVGQVRSNQPALHELHDRAVETTRQLVDAIRAIQIEGWDDEPDGLLASRYESARLRERARRLLTPFEPHLAEVLSLRNANAAMDGVRLDPRDANRWGVSADTQRAEFVYLVLSRTLSRKKRPVILNEESDGTRRLLELTPALLEAIDNGKSVFVDEIERSLHPLMTRDLVRSWCETPNKNGQLIFTTHDTRLLDVLASQPDFHPASIVFTEKGPDLATHFHTLAEYKPEQIGQLKDALETGYLAGRFGAIPLFTRSAPKPDRAAE